MMIIRHIKECFPLNINKQQETTDEHCIDDMLYPHDDFHYLSFIL